jgi:Flp pilus assembly protein TadD
MNSLRICVILCLLVVSACKQPEPRTSEDRQKILDQTKGPEITGVKGTLLQQAEDAMKAGETRRAEQMYDQLLSTNSDNAEYQQKLADLRRRNGNFDGALELFDKILVKQPDSIDAKEGKALALLGKSEVKAAGDLFGEVLAKDNTRWRSLNAVGILFAVKGMASEANSYFSEAMKHTTHPATVLNNIALTKALVRNFDEAVSTFMDARSKLPAGSPDLARIDMNLALTYGIMGRIEDAQKISESHLTPEQLYNNLGFYAMLNKDSALAKTYLNMALSQSPRYYEKAWNTLDIITGTPSSPGDLPSFKVQ